MSIEQFPRPQAQQQEKTEGENQEKQRNSAAEEIYDAWNLKGPARDFERILQGGAQIRTKLEELSPEGKEFFEDVVSVIDTDKFSLEGLNFEQVIRVIRLAAEEYKWTDYESVQFEKMRTELGKANIPLRPKKTSLDIAA